MYRTSSFSQNNGGCVAADIDWHKASASAVNNCVEAGSRHMGCQNVTCVDVQESDGCPLVHVRDSKLGDASPVLDFSREIWDGGAGIIFEPVSVLRVPSGKNTPLGVATVRTPNAAAMSWFRVTSDLSPGRELWFHQNEVDAWHAGVANREFALA